MYQEGSGKYKPQMLVLGIDFWSLNNSKCSEPSVQVFLYGFKYMFAYSFCSCSLSSTDKLKVLGTIAFYSLYILCYLLIFGSSLSWSLALIFLHIEIKFRYKIKDDFEKLFYAHCLNICLCEGVGSWRYRQTWASMWLLGIEPWISGVQPVPLTTDSSLFFHSWLLTPKILFVLFLKKYCLKYIRYIVLI